MALEEHAELVVKTKSGESYTIAESRIIKGSLTASSSCSSGGGIPAGSCNIGTASVAFRAPSGLTYKKLYRATVEIYAWYQGYSKELYGTYNVSSAENNYGVYTLSLSDNISLLDESCYAANDTENAENWLYSQMAGRWNVPSVILNYICNAYNVPHYNAAENEKYVPDSGNTALSTGVSSECSVESVKDFANYLAEYLGCFIAAAPDGRVRFSRLGEREYKTELNQSNISRGTLQRSPYYVHPSVWKVSFDSGYGSSWYVSSDLPDDAAPLSINITNNPFWQVQEDRVPADIYGGKVTQMIKYMWDYLYNAAIKKDGNTVEYMINPFSCTVHLPYHFRIGDIVTVRDYVNGDVFRSYLTDITWTFRGGQQISCAGDDTRTLSVGTSRSAAKKSNDYSKYLYRKSKTDSSGGDTNTYTKAEIDAKDASVKSAADKAQETADGAVSVNNTQNTKISALQKSAHTHANKDVLDKTEQPYTTAERDKLAGLENYVHPSHTAHGKGMYKVAVDGEGHVTEADAVTKSDITALGIPGEDTYYTYRIYSTINRENNGTTTMTLRRAEYKNGSRFGYEFAIAGFKWVGTSDVLNGVIRFGGYLEGTSYDGESYPASGASEVGTILSVELEPRSETTVYAVSKLSTSAKTKQHFYLDPSITCAPAKWDSVSEPSKVLIGYDAPDGTSAHLPVYFADDIWCGNDTKSLNAQITEKYTKPSTGIPKSDLASGVQASLGKADTALQKHQDISGKLDKTGDASNTTVAFSATSARENVKTGEKLSVIVGKIAKWFADLKTVAFTGSYNDLANKPTIPDGSKYLPLAGGKMTGDIDIASNGVDLLVGLQRATQATYATAVAGATISTKQTFSSGLPERKSLVGSFLDQNSVWHSIISVRHRSGYNDGVNYGMYLRSLLTSDGNLIWNKQTAANTWQGERVLLDSGNYTSYAAKSDHSHGLLNQYLEVTIPSTTEDAGWSLLNTTYTGHLLKSIRTSANAPDWLFGNYSAGICFGGADTHGVIMCTYDYPRVKIAGGNGTKPKWYFTFQGKPGTLYDFESMPYAKVATTLTDSGWVAMTVEGYAKSGTVKYRTYGKQITITGSVVLKNDIATSYPAPQYIASTTFDFSKIVGCSGVGRSSSGVGVFVDATNFNGDNIVFVNALGSKIAAGATLFFTITGFID